MHPLPAAQKCLRYCAPITLEAVTPHLVLIINLGFSRTIMPGPLKHLLVLASVIQLISFL